MSLKSNKDKELKNFVIEYVLKNYPEIKNDAELVSDVYDDYVGELPKIFKGHIFNPAKTYQFSGYFQLSYSPTKFLRHYGRAFVKKVEKKLSTKEYYRQTKIFLNVIYNNERSKAITAYKRRILNAFNEVARDFNEWKIETKQQGWGWINKRNK
mgnify:CR=1 FL=1|tara:strand:- start:625 stop:1086 length:462 start_codon:yes stop_codon:yes gene_type:complete